MSEPKSCLPLTELELLEKLLQCYQSSVKLEQAAAEGFRVALNATELERGRLNVENDDLRKQRIQWVTWAVLMTAVVIWAVLR